eukprot:TRINITY_DN40657_c0_g1_i1.p1 TRINITY_DN40657_c0_g1~~TRINITY_DN40657_c0_g1_i1.p1  ORF type:complete len:542 (-),score=81.29 TRINITY_DN40657_c0_g1_i1:12-1598(-)
MLTKAVAPSTLSKQFVVAEPRTPCRGSRSFSTLQPRPRFKALSPVPCSALVLAVGNAARRWRRWQRQRLPGSPVFANSAAKAAAASPEVPSKLDLLRFAAPLAAVSIAGPVLSTIDAAFVGRCAGTVDLAALGPACTVTDLIYLICSTVSTAAIKLYADVEGDKEKQKRHTATCLFLALAIGTTAAITSLILGTLLLRALGATPIMLVPAHRYVVIRAVGLPLATLASAMYGLCVGQGDTKTPLLVTVGLSALLNVLFDWLLCAVFAMGAAGAAWATVAAQMTSFIAYTAIMRRKGQLPLPKLRQFVPSLTEARPVLSVFFPISFIVICVLSMYACMSGFVNTTQPIAMVAAYKIWISIFAFFALCADPLAAATTTKLPPLINSGSSTAVRLFVRRAIWCATGVGASGALLGAGILRYCSYAFTQDAAVVAGASVGLFHFVAILTLMHPTRVFQNTLVAHGDFLFYVAAAAGLSSLFFVGLVALAGRCVTGSLSAYLSMLTATLVFYISSICVYGLRARQLNRRVRPA